MSVASTYLRLEVIGGKATGDTIVVDDELVIGRHATGAGRLSDDEEISRQHARISREATGDYAVEDLDSSNGTFVNGLRIRSPRLLSLGDSIETGATTLVVREIVRPAPVEAPAEPDGPASDPVHASTVFAPSPVAHQTTSVQEIGTAGEPTVPVQPPVEPTGPLAPPPAPVQPGGEIAPPPTPVEPADEIASPPPAPAEPPSPPPLALRLDVDFAAREARIALGDGGETVRMVFEDGAWRARPAGLDPDR